ncbi:hypothetical protein PINS_up006566 [Pythium insidiosum]|nr:hypothetical protein PINS_up006566 [Pythium insidiosum]
MTPRVRQRWPWRQWLFLAIATVGGVLYVGSLVGLQQSLVAAPTNDHSSPSGDRESATALLLTRATPENSNREHERRRDTTTSRDDDAPPEPTAHAPSPVPTSAVQVPTPVVPTTSAPTPTSNVGSRAPSIAPAPAPVKTRTERQAELVQELCRRYRDYGIQDELRASARSFCGRASRETSSYVVYHSREAELQGTVATNLWIDLRRATVHRPIKNIARDGGNHDPRLQHASVDVRCLCATPQDEAHGVPRVWHDLLAQDPSTNYTTCRPTTLRREDEAAARNASLVRRIRHRAILLARRDDHNPFFQISATLNAWLMLDVIGWRAETTQLVYLDDGFPSPIDELQKAGALADAGRRLGPRAARARRALRRAFPRAVRVWRSHDAPPR